MTTTIVMNASSTNEPRFVYLYINGIKNAFVKALRTAFLNEATPSKFRYNEDITKSQVDIRSDFPQRIIKVPIINVEIDAGNADVTYVGDEFLGEATLANDGVDGYRFGGKLTLNVNINILGGTMRDTEHLSDLVALYVRYLFRNKFAESNMAYTKCSVGKIMEEGQYFKGSVSTETTTEFDHILAKNLYETINDINFEIGTYF
jgi:hypothetical protein